MKATRIHTLVIVALLGGALLLTHSWAQPARPAGSTVGVCDLVEVFNNYQRAKDLTAQLNDRRQAIQAEGKKRSDAIDALRQELENYKKGTKKYQETAHQIQWLGLQAQGWLKYQDGLAMEEHRELTKEMYEEIRAMIAQVAKQRGISMVLQREPGDLETDNTAELLRQIYNHKVLYAAEDLEITEAVLLSLNQAYRAKKPAAKTP
ncbi:MAG TPA: OmpH family outer membrane protein [Phycisphaerae bacterium]|nr:OmpH family outer membrane protein [Phycisphaerae bacterium]